MTATTSSFSSLPFFVAVIAVAIVTTVTTSSFSCRLLFVQSSASLVLQHRQRAIYLFSFLFEAVVAIPFTMTSATSYSCRLLPLLQSLVQRQQQQALSLVAFLLSTLSPVPNQ